MLCGNYRELQQAPEIANFKRSMVELSHQFTDFENERYAMNEKSEFSQGVSA